MKNTTLSAWHNGSSSGNSGGAGGGQPPPPTFRKSAQFVGNFRLCRNFKTMEYTEIDRKNYWRVRQLISTERRFDYLKLFV